MNHESAAELRLDHRPLLGLERRLIANAKNEKKTLRPGRPPAATVDLFLFSLEEARRRRQIVNLGAKGKTETPEGTKDRTDKGEQCERGYIGGYEPRPNVRQRRCYVPKPTMVV
jgi:hypothetical protein